jgi:hypothetical protein
MGFDPLGQKKSTPLRTNFLLPQSKRFGVLSMLSLLPLVQAISIATSTHHLGISDCEYLGFSPLVVFPPSLRLFQTSNI